MKKNIAFLLVVSIVLLFSLYYFMIYFKQKNNNALDYFKSEDYISSSRLLKSLIDKKKNDILLNYNYAATKYKLFNYDDAIDIYNAMLNNTNIDDLLKSEIYFNLGNIYFLKNNNDMAIENYKTALILNPDDFEAKYNIEFIINLNQMLTYPEEIMEQIEENIKEQDELVEKEKEKINNDIEKIEEKEKELKEKSEKQKEEISEIEKQNKQNIQKEMQSLIKEKESVEKTKKQLEEKIKQQEKQKGLQQGSKKEQEQLQNLLKQESLIEQKKQELKEKIEQQKGNGKEQEELQKLLEQEVFIEQRKQELEEKIDKQNQNSSNKHNEIKNLEEQKKNLQQQLMKEFNKQNAKMELVEQIELDIVQEVVRPDKVVNPKKIIDRYILADGLVRHKKESHVLLEEEKELIFRDIIVGFDPESKEEEHEEKHQIIYNDPDAVSDSNKKPGKYKYVHEDIITGKNQSKYKVKDQDYTDSTQQKIQGDNLQLGQEEQDQQEQDQQEQNNNRAVQNTLNNIGFQKQKIFKESSENQMDILNKISQIDQQIALLNEQQKSQLQEQKDNLNSTLDSIKQEKSELQSSLNKTRSQNYGKRKISETRVR